MNEPLAVIYAVTDNNERIRALTQDVESNGVAYATFDIANPATICAMTLVFCGEDVATSHVHPIKVSVGDSVTIRWPFER